MESDALPPPSEPRATSCRAPQRDDAGAYAALASMADAVFCVDTAGRFTFVNAAFEAMTGYARVDLLGAPSTRFYVPEAEALFLERRRQVYSGRPVSPYLETVLLLKDGTQLPVELTVSSLIIEGQVVGRVGVLRDITERKQAEEALRRERALLEAILQQLPVGVIIAEAPSGKLMLGNEQVSHIWGHDFIASEGIEQYEAYKGFHADGRRYLPHEWPLARTITTGEYVEREEIRFQRGDGSFAWMAVTSAPVRDVEGNTVAGVVIFADITVRKQAEDARRTLNTTLEKRVAERTTALEQAHDALRREMAERHRMQEALLQQEKLAALGTLLANVAHELNNPLAVATMQIDNLKVRGDTATWTEDLEMLQQAVARCKSVVQSFLTLARQQPSERHAVALHAVIDDVLVLLGRALEMDGITIESRIADDLPLLWADADQLHHVVANLITNARHALRETAPLRRLRLTAVVTDDRSRVILEVTDNGPGMAQDLQRRAFEPFFTTKPQGEGSGLGLPLCRSIVEGHGGTIQIASQPGHGTTISVTLPAAASEVRFPQATPEPVELAPTQRGAILIIDDEPSIQQALRRLLRRSGHAITTATNGLEGLAALEARAYEVILCDMRMPVLDGMGFYRELERRYPHLLSRVIFLTGDVFSPEAEAFFAQVGNPCLFKPFKAQDVQRAIQQMLSGSVSMGSTD